jgi:hypothetical protein
MEPRQRIATQKIATEVAEKMLDYKNGEVTINLIYNIEAIISALNSDLSDKIKKITLIADALDKFEDINKIMSIMEDLPNLESVILNLDKVKTQGLHPKLPGDISIFNSDFSNWISYYYSKINALQPDLLSLVNLTKLKQVKNLKIIGYLRCVALDPLLELPSLTKLDLVRCSITYDTSMNLVNCLHKNNSKLEHINISHNPIAVTSIIGTSVFYKKYINELFLAMQACLVRSNGKLIINMEGCFNIGHDFGDHTQFPSWKPVGALLEHHHSLLSTESLNKEFNAYKETREASMLFLSASQNSNNEILKQSYLNTTTSLTASRLKIKSSAKSLKATGSNDGHYTYAQFKYTEGKLAKAYAYYDAIPSSHPKYAKAQYAIISLVEPLDGIEDLEEMLGKKHIAWRTGDFSLDRLVLLLQHASNLVNAQAENADAAIQAVKNVVSRTLSEQHVALVDNYFATGCNLWCLMTGFMQMSIKQQKVIDLLSDDQRRLNEELEASQLGTPPVQQPRLLHQFNLAPLPQAHVTQTTDRNNPNVAQLNLG